MKPHPLPLWQGPGIPGDISADGKYGGGDNGGIFVTATQRLPTGH